MSHVTKRVGKGQAWGAVGTSRGAYVEAYVSEDKKELIKSRAASLGMTVSRYLNALVARDIGTGYEAS